MKKLITTIDFNFVYELFIHWESNDYICIDLLTIDFIVFDSIVLAYL